MCVFVCPSPANLPLCGLVGRDVCCVCVCVSLTGKPASVRSCREGCVLCVYLCIPHRRTYLCDDEEAKQQLILD